MIAKANRINLDLKNWFEIKYISKLENCRYDSEISDKEQSRLNDTKSQK